MAFLTGSVPAFFLILLLCAIACGRCFFQDRISRDSLSVLALANLILCALCFWAWGISPAFLTAFFVSFIVFLINWRCILRFLERLRHGKFSKGFMCASIIMLLVVFAAGALLVFTRPVPIDRAGARTEKTLWTGSLRSGFLPRTSFFESVNAYVWTFAPETQDADIPLVLFVSGTRSSVSDYEPFLLSLAREGYEIKVAEFYAIDNKRFTALFDLKMFRKFAARLSFISAFRSAEKTLADFSAQDAVYSAAHDAITAQEYGALIEHFGREAAKNGRKVFLLSDSDAGAVKRAGGSFWQGIPVSLSLGPVSGFGFIEQTDPLTALLFDLQRDPSLESPRRALKEWTRLTASQGDSYDTD